MSAVHKFLFIFFGRSVREKNGSIRLQITEIRADFKYSNLWSDLPFSVWQNLFINMNAM